MWATRDFGKNGMANNTNAEVPELIQTIGVKLFPNFSNQLAPKKSDVNNDIFPKLKISAYPSASQPLGVERASKSRIARKAIPVPRPAADSTRPAPSFELYPK